MYHEPHPVYLIIVLYNLRYETNTLYLAVFIFVLQMIICNQINFDFVH